MEKKNFMEILYAIFKEFNERKYVLSPDKYNLERKLKSLMVYAD